MAVRKRSFVVIGLGAFGSTVAADLVRFDNFVTGVDIDDRRVAQMSQALSQSFILDATEDAALREAGIDQHEVAIVAIGGNIEASILTVMNLRMIGVKKIWCKARGRTHHRILSKLGVDRVIEPEREMGQHTAQVLHNPAVRDYFSLGNGFHMVTIDVPKSISGKTIGALKLASRFSLRSTGLMRGAVFHECSDADLMLEEGDKLLLLGKRPDLRHFGDTL